MTANSTYVPPMDGQTYLTGWRINGQHCGRCGFPAPGQTLRHTDIGQSESLTTDCCSFGFCHGYVTTTPWRLVDAAGPEVWACCLGEAERHLGGRAITGPPPSPPCGPQSAERPENVPEQV